MSTAVLPERPGAMVDLAEKASVTADAASRQRRLAQDRRPTTASSTGSWVNWSSAADVLGQPFDMVRIPLPKLEQMRRDPMLAFGLAFVKVPLVRAPWYIKCADPRIAAAVEQSLRRIYGRFIMAYCNSFDFGFSPMVKRFELDSPDWTYSADIDGRMQELPVWDATAKMMVWKPFTALNPRACTPHWNKRGEFNGIDFNSAAAGMSPFFNSASAAVFPSLNSSPRQADIPVDWAMWATNEKDSVFGSYWGYPRIGYAYRYWWAYWYRFGLADRAFERWADPPILAFHPSDIGVDEDGNTLDLPAEALALAEQLRSGANVSLPSTVVTGYDERQTNVREWWLEQMDSKADFESLNKAFEYLDVQKLRSVMVPEQALVEGKGGTSSRNVAATFGDVFQESQAVVKQEIDDQINRYIIPQFVEVNFGPDAPKAEIVTTGFDPADLETMQEIVRLIGQRETFAEVDQRTLLERLGIPLLSYDRVQRRLDEIAVKAEQAKAEAREPEDGMAGISELGQYFRGRDRINLGSRDMVFVERSEEVDLGRAIYMPETRRMLIHPDQDPDILQQVLINGAFDAKQELGEGADPNQESFVLTLEALGKAVAALGEAKVAEPQPVEARKTKETWLYTTNEEGLNTGFTIEIEEVEDGEEA